MSFSRRKQLIVFNYKISSPQLLRTEQKKDLGITFDNELNFIQHIEILTKSAAKSLGFILRLSRDFGDLEITKLLYSAFVLSKLEYCALIWNPLYQCHENSLEKVQRKLLKYLTFLKSGSYPPQGYDLLSDHNFLSLQKQKYSVGQSTSLKMQKYCRNFLCMYRVSNVTWVYALFMEL